MIRLVLRSFAVVLTIVALSSCGTTPQRTEPKGVVTIALDAAKKPTEATAKFDYLITIVLPPPGVEGTVWQISFHDSRYLQQVTDITPAADRSAQISFRTKQPGRTRVRFVLVPSTTDRAVAAVDSQELILVIQ
jgi:hypothetical protein